jgi:hypothetical protein
MRELIVGAVVSAALAFAYFVSPVAARGKLDAASLRRNRRRAVIFTAAAVCLGVAAIVISL